MPVKRRRRGAYLAQGQRSHVVMLSQVVLACFLFALVFSLLQLPENYAEPTLKWLDAGLNWDWDLIKGVALLMNEGGLQLGWDRWWGYWGDYELPQRGSLLWPAGGPVVAAFGWQDAGVGGQLLADGIEISAPVGSPVRAAYAGTVTAVRMSPVYGMVIEVDHGNRLVTVYGHCDEAQVAPKQRVSEGQLLAQVARPQQGPSQLYFEVRLSGQAVDPLYWLRDEESSW